MPTHESARNGSGQRFNGETALSSARPAGRGHMLPPRLVLLACLLTAACGAEPAPRSIVVITLDTTRADALSCYGFPLPTTPTIDAVARRGMLFEKAYAPMSQTLPSHASLFTGSSPRVHGALENQINLLPTVTTMTERLRDRGYVTAAFTAARVLDESTGIERGFQTFRPPKSTHHGAERRSDEVTDEALAWLEGERNDSPHFLWVHYFDAHAPYEPVEAVLAREPIEAWLAGRPELPGITSGFAAARWQSYVNEIVHVDGQLNRLLDGLQTAPWMKDAVLVIVGDHGEGFFEHGDNSHALQITEEHVHVPLIIAAPDGELGGTRMPAPVRMFDVMPTVLTLARTGLAPVLEGVDLMPELRGERAPVTRTVFLERPHFEYKRFMERFGERGLTYGLLAAIVVDGMKFVREPDGSSKLHDLRSDPLERIDLAAGRPDVAERLGRALDGWLDAHPVGDAADRPAISEERETALRQLGY